MTNLLKGDAFLNRYRITGTLTTAAPLHIGTGESRAIPLPGNDTTVQVSTIVTDHRGKPLIPGSTLRGVLRNWLLTVLEGVGTQWATERDYAGAGLLALPQDQQISLAKTTFSSLELIFGTPLNAGKVEVWDATCMTGTLALNDTLLGWNPTRLTYIDTSVAIDPARGTAKDKLLYKADIVPPGVEFQLDLVGQNLSEDELGLILLVLEGFNSAIYPIHVGARGGRGYGRMKFALSAVYRLDRTGLQTWLKATLGAPPPNDPGPAGYYGLPRLSEAEQGQLIATTKNKLIATIEG